METVAKYVGLISALAALLWGCSSSLVGADDLGLDAGDLDGGLIVLDASDNRPIPTVCQTVAQCDDLDPCTNEECVGGKCRFTMKAVALEPLAAVTPLRALDVALASNTLYLAEGDAGVEAYDITNPNAPRLKGVVLTPGDALKVDADDRGFLVAEAEIGMESFSAAGLSVIENVWLSVDEVVDVSIGPGYAIASAYADGASIVDVENFADPNRIVNLDSMGRAVGAASNASSGLVADSLAGAAAIVFFAEEGPRFGGQIATNGRVVDVSVSGSMALLAEYGSGFSVVDFSDPDHPQRLAQVKRPSNCVAVALLGQQSGLVAEESGLISFYDFIDPFRPRVVSTYKSDYLPVGIDVYQGKAALALGQFGAQLLDTRCFAASPQSQGGGASALSPKGIENR